MHNHWGVRVVSPEEVDRAYDYLVAHKTEYKLGAIGKPTWSHGSYSCYFVEPGTNGWEIECYEAFNRKQTTAERFGAVKMAHWDRLLPEERFPAAVTCRRASPTVPWWRLTWRRARIFTPVYWAWMRTDSAIT